MTEITVTIATAVYYVRCPDLVIALGTIIMGVTLLPRTGLNIVLKQEFYVEENCDVKDSAIFTEFHHTTYLLIAM